MKNPKKEGTCCNSSLSGCSDMFLLANVLPHRGTMQACTDTSQQLGKVQRLHQKNEFRKRAARTATDQELVAFNKC